MPFQKMQDFTFKHSDQQDAIYTEYTAQQIKALFDSRGDELRTALNLLVTALNSTEGASNIGTQSIQDVDGETIQAMLKSIRDKLKSKIDGSSGADYVHATAIEGLTGETVQSILEALKSLVDGNRVVLDSKINTTKSDLENLISTNNTNLDNKITETKSNLEGQINASLHGIKASTISAEPIASGSGNTVQAQLAWLLSQIAIAATGSIPDGSISEAKLTQMLVDKINKALSNTGVLSTLTTTDKSSAVNAINELKEELDNINLTDTNINVTDPNNHFTSDKLNGVLDELFTNADNLKNNWVDVIGSPLSSVDDSTQLKSKTQEIKNTLATPLGVANSSALSTMASTLLTRRNSLASAVNAKGVAAGSGDTLSQLVAKIGQISTGKKFAQGSGNAQSGNNTTVRYITISNLTFKPSVLIVAYRTVGNYSAGHKGYSFQVYSEVPIFLGSVTSPTPPSAKHLYVTNYGYTGTSVGWSDPTGLILNDNGFQLRVFSNSDNTGQEELTYDFIAIGGA